MNTNTKKFKIKVQKHILSHFDSYENLENEINHYFKNFGFKYGLTMVALIVIMAKLLKQWQNGLNMTM